MVLVVMKLGYDYRNVLSKGAGKKLALFKSASCY